MAGVMSISLGCAPAARYPAFVECAERIWRQSQPAVSVYNGSRLGSCRMRAVVGSLQQKVVDPLGNFPIRLPMADGVLERTNIFSIAKGKFIVCADRISPVISGDTDQCNESQDPKILHQKRGI